MMWRPELHVILQVWSSHCFLKMQQNVTNFDFLCPDLLKESLPHILFTTLSACVATFMEWWTWTPGFLCSSVLGSNLSCMVYVIAPSVCVCMSLHHFHFPKYITLHMSGLTCVFYSMLLYLCGTWLHIEWHPTLADEFKPRLAPSISLHWSSQYNSAFQAKLI